MARRAHRALGVGTWIRMVAEEPLRTLKSLVDHIDGHTRHIRNISAEQRQVADTLVSPAAISTSSTCPSRSGPVSPRLRRFGRRPRRRPITPDRYLRWTIWSVSGLDWAAGRTDGNIVWR
jgi:hypothetical protein